MLRNPSCDSHVVGSKKENMSRYQVNRGLPLWILGGIVILETCHAHLCLISPTQRGSLAGINKEGTKDSRFYFPAKFSSYETISFEHFYGNAWLCCFRTTAFFPLKNGNLLSDSEILTPLRVSARALPPPPIPPWFYMGIGIRHRAV